VGKETTVRHSGKQHSHDNKMLEKEVKKMVGAAMDEATNNLTLNPRAVHQSIVAKMMEKHRNQSALRLLPTYKAFQQRESRGSTRVQGHFGSHYPRLIWTCSGLLITIWDCHLIW